jgi:hypothetical protein
MITKINMVEMVIKKRMGASVAIVIMVAAVTKVMLGLVR